MSNLIQSQLYSEYSDLYKDAYGIRPRFAAYFTVSQLREAIARTQQVILREIAEEEAVREREELDFAEHVAKMDKILSTQNAGFSPFAELLA